ncbi:hypothetical protein [Vibrio eleionomae]|uniref:hypothetical protein n=1 Tax=Vibrio eleionomae TaxID=2653505 RepID=UPI001926790C|nr:hypothetical protein [Vibrio eleionomae]
MAEMNNYQMAIDLLRCHLGLTEEEAKHQLGLDKTKTVEKNDTSGGINWLDYSDE